MRSSGQWQLQCRFGLREARSLVSRVPVGAVMLPAPRTQVRFARRHVCCLGRRVTGGVAELPWWERFEFTSINLFIFINHFRAKFLV